MVAVKFNRFFGGYLAFKFGKVLRTKTQGVKVFKTEAEALKAANKSQMQIGL